MILVFLAIPKILKHGTKQNFLKSLIWTESFSVSFHTLLQYSSWRINMNGKSHSLNMQTGKYPLPLGLQGGWEQSSQVWKCRIKNYHLRSSRVLWFKTWKHSLPKTKQVFYQCDWKLSSSGDEKCPDE